MTSCDIFYCNSLKYLNVRLNIMKPNITAVYYILLPNALNNQRVNFDSIIERLTRINNMLKSKQFYNDLQSISQELDAINMLITNARSIR
jgi:hypothetical protein